MSGNQQLELLQRVGYSNKVSSGDSSGSGGGGQNAYGDMFQSDGNENEQIENFIENIMNSNNIRVITLGLSTIFDACKGFKSATSFESASMLKFMDLSVGSTGLKIPTPGAAFGLKASQGKGR
jgi:hypothetical protein